MSVGFKQINDSKIISSLIFPSSSSVIQTFHPLAQITRMYTGPAEMKFALKDNKIIFLVSTIFIWLGRDTNTDLNDNRGYESESSRVGHLTYCWEKCNKYST